MNATTTLSGGLGRPSAAVFLGVAGILAFLSFASLVLGFPFYVAAVIPIGVVGAMYLARHPLFVLYVAVALIYAPRLSLGPVTLFQVAGALAVVGAAADHAVRRKAPRLTSVFPGYVAFTGLIVLSLTFASHLPSALSYLYEWLRNLVLVLLVINYLGERRRLRTLLGIVLAAAAASATAAIVESQLLGGYRPAALVGDPNRLAGLLNLAIPVALALSIDAGRRAWRLVGMGLAMILVLAVLTTASRGGVAACVVGVLAFVVLNLRRWPVFVPLAIGIAALVPFVPDTVWQRFTHIQQQMLQTVDIEGQVQLTDRGELNRAALAMWRDHPWFGVGAGQFYHTAPDARYLPGSRLWSRSLSVVAHNMYLQALAENGPPGVVVLLWLILASCLAVFAVWRRAGREGDRMMRTFSTVLAAMMASTLTIAFTLNFLYVKEVHLLFGLCFALGVAAARPVGEGDQGQESGDALMPGSREPAWSAASES